MKKLLMTSLAVLASTALFAKDESLITEFDTWKMYTRPELVLTEIAGDNVTLLDLGIGWILNEKLALGPVLAVSFSDVGGGDKGRIDSTDFYYWGVRGDYTFRASKLLHTSASLLVASGSVKVSGEDTSGFMVFEPAVNGAINVLEGLEIGLSLGYRFTDGSSAGGYEGDDFRGAHVGFFARFTGF